MSQQHIPGTQEPEIAGFVSKTYQILNNQEFNKIIYWGPTGKQFVIKDITKFQQIVLPKYFRHKKINSFIRQLNMYGFHKSRKQNTKSIFSHPYFIKDRQDLLTSIKRKIKLPQTQLLTPIKNQSYKFIDIGNKDIQTPSTIKDYPSLKYYQQQQINLKSLLQSKQYLNSRVNINYSASLNKLSQSYIGQIMDINQGDDNEECLSIEQGIEQNIEKNRNKKIISKQNQGNLDNPVKFENPSCFFISESEHE